MECEEDDGNERREKIKIQGEGGEANEEKKCEEEQERGEKTIGIEDLIV